jgi:hypothetical protein
VQPLNCAPRILPCRALIASRPLLALQGGGCTVLRYRGANQHSRRSRPFNNQWAFGSVFTAWVVIESSPQRYLAQTTVDGELLAEAR